MFEAVELHEIHNHGGTSIESMVDGGHGEGRRDVPGPPVVGRGTEGGDRQGRADEDWRIRRGAMQLLEQSGATVGPTLASAEGVRSAAPARVPRRGRVSSTARERLQAA